MKKIQYLPYLDGLRFISIILVIFYHAEISLFSGGYIGVDIFFVISGYLISQIFHNNYNQKNFYALFFESRIRRILPGLVLVCFATIPISWLILFPGELLKFSNSLISAPLFFSNVTFYFQSNYFDKLAIDIPLLHSWSLSVEIQFYIMFAALMFIISKFTQKIKLTIIVFFTFFLFCVSHYFSTHNLRLENFYLPIPRFWEFLAGVLVYYIQVRKSLKNNFYLNNFFSFIGISIIILSLFLIDKNSRFPGAITLLPIIGASLVILYGNNDNYVGKILSFKLFTNIGKVSYSLYLWHYPIFSFYNLYFIKIDTLFEKFLLIFFSFFCAILSYQFIEKPMRDKSKYSLKDFTKVILILVILITAYSLFIKKFNGFEKRFSNKTLQYLKVLEEKNFYPNINCSNKKVGKNCIINEKEFSNQIAIWGDSVANLAVDEIVKVNNEFDKSTIIYTYLGCPPFSFYNHIDSNCSKRNQKILKEILNNRNLSTVIIFGEYFQDTVNREDKIERSKAIKNTIEKIIFKNKNVIFIYPIPKIKDDLPYIKARESSRNLNRVYNGKLQDYLNKNKVLFDAIENINEKNFSVIFSHKIFCSKDYNICETEKNNKLYYVDKGHPSQFAIKKISKRLKKKIKEIYQ